MGSIREDEKENMNPIQQWIIKPSPKKSDHDSFLEDESRLSESPSSNTSSSSDLEKTTPKKQGILRHAATPGTGQSVRFGKRLYDDGDESKMSNSTANSSALARSLNMQEISEDAVDMSLGFLRSPRKVSIADSDDSGELEDDSQLLSPSASPTLQSNQSILRDNTTRQQSRMGDGTSRDTIALPNLEGYSNLEDISLDYGVRDDTTVPTLSRTEKMSVDSFEDMSFNESFLREEMERAKRGMEQEATVHQANTTTHQTTTTSAEVSLSEPTVIGIGVGGEESTIEKSRHQVGTPLGANTTQASEYMSTRSQASSVSPSSTAPHWNTPNSRCYSPGQLAKEEVEAETSAANEEASSSSCDNVNESPSVQRMNRRFSFKSPLQSSPGPSLARLQSLTNTPARRSPLSEVVMSPATFADGSMSLMAPGGYIRERPSSHVVSTLPSSDDVPASPSQQSSSSVIDVVLRETDELDQVHSERSEMLLKWIRQTEDDSEQTRRLLETERERTIHALEEAKAARLNLQKMKEEAERVETQRNERLQELEELTLKLHDQLGRRADVAREQPQEESLTQEFQNRITELEKKLEVQDEELKESREEQKALQDALVSAQKQIGNMQGDEYRDKEAHSCTTDELAVLQTQLKDVEAALLFAEDQVTSKAAACEESSWKYMDTVDKFEQEKAQWQKKLEKLENENDGLLQSLAEAEEHKRAMEDGFLSKQDSALKESRAREEQAIRLAEEMQSRLEKVESKLEAMTTRTTMLEHEVGNRGLQLVKLEKAKARLEEDNLNYSIALSSKQQELSLLKRNTSRSERNTPMSTVNPTKHLSTDATRTSTTVSKGPLSEIQVQEADESGSSLAPLQSGPLVGKTMRRKTMDVHTPNVRARVSNSRVVGAGRLSLAMAPPLSTAKLIRPKAERQKSFEEEKKIVGRSSRPSSQASSQRSSDSIRSSLPSSHVPSRRSSSSSVTVQAKSNQSLSSSIIVSEGPMDISELETSLEGSKLRQRLQQARVPMTLPLRTRSSIGIVSS